MKFMRGPLPLALPLLTRIRMATPDRADFTLFLLIIIYNINNHATINNVTYLDDIWTVYSYTYTDVPDYGVMNSITLFYGHLQLKM